MGFIRLRVELRALRAVLEELREAIKEHSDAIHAEEERKRHERSAKNTVHAVVSYDDKTVRDAQTENERQYCTQRSIKRAAWSAFMAASIYALIAAYQANEMRKATVAAQTSANAATAQLDATTRPWLEVTPEIFKIFFSMWYDQPHVHIPIKCNIVNYGASPAINVLCRTRIDSVPPLSPKFWAESDSRLQTLCDDTNNDSNAHPQSGIPIFQRKEPVVINSGSENIDNRYFQMASTIYMVQGCVDYTYGAGKHGQTTFRYLMGKFRNDNILHGIPFIRGTEVENGPGHFSRYTMNPKDVDFVKTDGGNYAK
jgi:hypothetical protein